MYTASQSNQLVTLSRAYIGKKLINKNEELAELKEILRFHEWRYYIKHEPLISDKEYDTLFAILEDYETKNPELITSDSPSQRVSSDLSDSFEKVEHKTPLLSLANSYNKEDLLDFDKQVKKRAGIDLQADIPYHIEPKLDGISLAVYYENDEFVRGATRGNGTIGDDISNNVRTIMSLPLKADFSTLNINHIELRGEAYIRIPDFERINKHRESMGESLFANPRNVVAGSLRMKNPKETSERNIELVIYQINHTDDRIENISTQSESLSLLKSLGFLTPEDITLKAKNIQEVIDFTETAAEKRDLLSYEIDGLVIKVESLDVQEQCGYTSHHPRWAIAYKFKAKQAHSKLEQVDYQVGKTGAITPVAKITPVELAGVTISSISMHNEEFIRAKDLRINDTIVVERAGDVIPYIVKVITDLRTGVEEKIVFPEFCPIEGNDQVKLVKQEGEAAWRCPNCICGQQDIQKAIHFVSKSAMNIDGLGKSMIEKFHSLGMIETIADIYRLDYDKIAQLEGYGIKSANNLKKAINLSKSPPLQRFLTGLNVHHLGKRASQLIAQEINHIKELFYWEEEKYISIKEIGPVLAKNMVEFFSYEENRQLIIVLEEIGLDLSAKDSDAKKESPHEGPFVGKTILFTGSLKEITRAEAKRVAESLGAKSLSAVSKNLDLLVVGEKAGSKLKKAKAIGTIKIIDEKTFLTIINDKE